ncbi:MAG TPA: hypothetical protein PKA00_01180 [Saprospiraceae bacterium]|nr:hypothetical protein [Saprospiraceae bacterium]HMQ81480.1 hypothetical protein [Saprospiraceae bacterium]
MRRNHYKHLILFALCGFALLRLPGVGEWAHTLSHWIFGGHHHHFENHAEESDHHHQLLGLVFSTITNPVEAGPMPFPTTPMNPVFVTLIIHNFPIFVIPTRLVKVPAYMRYMPQALFFDIFLPPG